MKKVFVLIAIFGMFALTGFKSDNVNNFIVNETIESVDMTANDMVVNEVLMDINSMEAPENWRVDVHDCDPHPPMVHSVDYYYFTEVIYAVGCAFEYLLQGFDYVEIWWFNGTSWVFWGVMGSPPES